ncbi:MAG: hypothetical protein ACE5GG_03320 [Candidatus Omnitrophota bacterium]
MTIGLPKEISAHGREIRSALLPREVKKITEAGYSLLAEKEVGLRLGIPDREYINAGATITRDRRRIFHQDIVVKLKPPLKQEFSLLRNNILFSMLHAEQNPLYIKLLRRASAWAVAMELLVNRAGERLIQCTDITGEQGMIMAFHLAAKSPRECKVLILGYGAVSSGAMKVAFSLGARVKILRRSEFPNIRHFLKNTDILVNGIAWPRAEREGRNYLVTRSMLKLMHKQGIVLDLSVDFPNIIETCRPTLIDRPVYTIDGIRHISIFGYPVLAPLSSSGRYSRQVMPILLKIAQCGTIERLPAYLRRAVVR